MERATEHPVPAGPLAVRWLAHALPELRAGTRGTARIRLENAGSAAWRSRSEAGVQLSYHWLDDRGNPIVWDGPRTPFPHPVAPGEAAELAVALAVPQPPGLYRLAFDLVEEYRFWFAEIGSSPLELPVQVLPRIDERRLAVVVHGGADEETVAALASQEEPLVEVDSVATAHLVAGAHPASDWSRRILDAHAEGFAAVGGSLEGRERVLRPWAPGGGRNPGFAHPLLLPSLLLGEPSEHLGLPAYEPGSVAPGEPWLYDGRIRVRLRRDRRRG
ncbi:MAG: hypothetical protein MSC30_08200 [Gaiellaceae bacterium MAG52_C11]|nr:hypothetical protein [Candidatus Gaiellasilicea maunaloa]